MTPSSPFSSSPSPSPSPSLSPWVVNQCHCQVPYPHPKLLKSYTISKNNDEKVLSRTNTRVGVKDANSTVFGLSQNLRLYVQFLAPVNRGSKFNKDKEEKLDYYVNMGYAIRTLIEEFLDIFYRELSFDIYRKKRERVK
ncbi:hypothetical protein ES332_A13G107700v1 [Gossypium tomentosum]|uniref:Uncharacterized protein n=1 Tax=Gossypium tomentosum TaxID=34277 RepID=A0A5D2MIQ7_GOSTO|nr:hypothetical protein ES332_A13G107700v1 [Gossypium tomentosum]